ncbi:MAG: haloacid dehalogenase-like hydrolase, partial [Deltaproteobacteria bacterium]|jgi:hypothetical protein|nr:haloacid dehalogenase-like hydrolase [Deltaproteobacteria bacterium]
MEAIEKWWKESAENQKTLGQNVTADKNWIVVLPDDIQ